MLSKVLLSLWLVAHSLADSTASFQPRRLAFASLQPGDEMTGSLLLDALVTDGLISITDIPDIDDSKKSVLSLLHPCVEASSETKTHQFADGTRRRTLASHTIPGPGGQQPMSHNSDSKVCHDFATASTSFRSTVGVVTQLLADRMAETLAVNITEGPLLTTASNHAFQSLREVVHGGEHLEHFHCYQKTNASAAEDTIDLHTDQGLFLVFTPGQMVSHDNKNALSSGFFVETVDGSIAEVEFTSEDDLVILLGDGVNQYINARLPSHQQLRALPHSLRMPTHQADEARVWYGRMVLPPSDAIHPAHGLAFGELRERLIDATYDQDESKSMALGCSGSRIARELHEDVTCAENALYCWHQCMDFADYNVTEASCQAQDLQLSCINPRLQISNGTLHGDYYPGCVSADAEMETPIPILPDYPRDEETCTKQGFYEFAAASGYNNTVVLLEDVAIFQYNLVQEQGSALLEGRLAFNGLFGWLGFGFANVTGALNGMLGAVSRYCCRRTMRLLSIEYSRNDVHLVTLLACYHGISGWKLHGLFWFGLELGKQHCRVSH